MRDVIRGFRSLVLAGMLAGLPAFLCGISQVYAKDMSSGTVIELPDEDQTALAVLGTGVVGKAVPAKSIVNGAEFMVLQPGKWTYRVVGGAPQDTQQVDVMASPPRDKTGRLWHRIVGKRFIEYFRRKRNGDLQLASEVDLKEDVLTRYHPVFSVIYGGMRPGETRSVKTDIAVYDLDNPTDEKYKGRLRVDHTYVGAYEVTVPAGTYPAVLFKSFYTGKVGPASVNDVGYVFYTKGIGIVAEVERSHVSAFLFYDKRTRIAKVLLHREMP